MPTFAKNTGMDLSVRIDAFSQLGKILASYTYQPERKQEGSAIELILDPAFGKAMQYNAWFTPDNLNLAVASIASLLEKPVLEKWLQHYRFPGKENERTIAVIMAGNIPLVGFHDFLCTLISGNRFLGKLSSDDPYLLPALAALLCNIEPGFSNRVAFTDEILKSFDAVIATGSNNSAEYFRYYFSKYPHIIRKNRNGIAILTGKETPEEISILANDVFFYFGLGCRNVSKFFLPEGYDLKILADAFSRFSPLFNHHKYYNNYIYQKSILQMNGLPFYDTGFLILRENLSIASPIAVIHYEYYQEMEKLLADLISHESEIQCVISSIEVPLRWSRPGEAQHPAPSDYADGVDTLQFLLSFSDK